MLALQGIRQACRRDANVAMTVAGVAFWVVLTASLLGAHTVATLAMTKPDQASSASSAANPP